MEVLWAGFLETDGFLLSLKLCRQQFPVSSEEQGSLCAGLLGESEGMVGAADPRLMVYGGQQKL